MINKIKLLTATAVLSLLSACGGGGGSEVSSPPPTLNLQSAWTTFRQQNGTTNYTISGAVNGASVSGTGQFIIGYSPSTSLLTTNPAGPFPGPSITQSNLSRTLLQLVSTATSSGGTVKVSSIENWYYDAAGQLKVIWDVEENEQTIISDFSAFPSAVTAGNAGSMFTGTVFSRLGYTCGIRNATYAVTASTATSLTITVNDTSNTTQRAIGQCTTSKSVTTYVFQLSGNTLTLKSVSGTDSSATGTITYTF
jgi:hypothetical protein